MAGEKLVDELQGMVESRKAEVEAERQQVSQAYRDEVLRRYPAHEKAFYNPWINELQKNAATAAADGRNNAVLQKDTYDKMVAELNTQLMDKVASHFEEQGLTAAVSSRDNGHIYYEMGKAFWANPTHWWTELMVSWSK